jgi:hypothetical protein
MNILKMAQRKIDYLNFDTINSTDTLNDAFDTNFTITTKYTNIKKIYLKNYMYMIEFYSWVYKKTHMYIIK